MINIVLVDKNLFNGLVNGTYYHITWNFHDTLILQIEENHEN